MGGRPQAASLVQGLRPRNAPLQNHRSPTVRLHTSGAAQLTWRRPTDCVNKTWNAPARTGRPRKMA